MDENTVIETLVIRDAEDAEFRWPWRSRSLSNKSSLLSVPSEMQSRMHAISAVVCGFSPHGSRRMEDFPNAIYLQNVARLDVLFGTS